MEGFAVGAMGTMVHTRDGGESWELLTSGTEEDLYSVRFFADGRAGITAGNNRTLLFSQDFGNTWTPASVAD